MAHSLASDSMHPGGKLPPTLTPTGHFAGKPTLPISRSVTLIGARKQARLQLISSTVSQSHALIVNADSGPYIRDLASREHVFVNGIEVREGALADGDEIQIGRFTFRFNESPHTQPIEAVREIKPAPGGQIEIGGADQPYPIQGKSILIGRRDLCEISLMEDTASTTHAIIFEMDGKRYLRDLASRTGTFVNGRQIHQVEINSGDEIKIGETTMRYVAEGAPATAHESLRASAPAAAAPVGDLSVGADDLMDLVQQAEPAPPMPARPTPQPKPVLPVARKGPAPKPPEPVGPPAGADALELVHDQAADTEDVELTPADLEVELEPVGIEPDATVPAEPAPVAHEPIPIESAEPQPVDLDEVELEPVDLAPVEPVPAPAAADHELEIHDDQPQAVEEDLIDLLPRETHAPAAPAAPVVTPQAEDEVELEPIHPVDEEELHAPPPPVQAEADETEASVQEQVERQPLHFSYDGMEPVAEEEIELEPTAPAAPAPKHATPAAHEPIPVDHDTEIAPVVEPEPEYEPAAETHQPAEPEPIAAEEPQQEPEEEFREVRARADELALDSVAPIPTVLPPSKFGPGASQLDLEPVGDIEADESIDDELDEPLEPPIEREATPHAEAEAESETEIEDEPAPAAEEKIAEPPTEQEEQPAADAGAEFEEEIGTSPRLAEGAESTEPEAELEAEAEPTEKVESSREELPEELPELDADSVEMQFPAFDESEIAQLDFGLPPAEPEPALPTDAFAVSDEPANGAIPLDLGAIDEEPIPDFTLPPVPENELKLDLADTIVGEQTPIFEMPPIPPMKMLGASAAPAKKKPAAPAPAAKAPAKEKKPVAPPPPPAPVAKEPPPAPVPAPPTDEKPPVKPLTVTEPPVVAPVSPKVEKVEKPGATAPAPIAEAPANKPQAAPAPPPPPAAPLKVVEAPEPVAEVTPPPPAAPPVPRQKIEVLEPTESTPESALDLDEAIAERESAAPDTPIEVELTDSSFGRAVDSFVGESTTGPIVEESAPEPEPELVPEAAPEPDRKVAPEAELEVEPAPPPPPPARPVHAPEPIAAELPDELELELAPLEIAPAAEAPKPVPPAPPAPVKSVVAEAPTDVDEDGAFDLLESSAAAPAAPASDNADKLFDLPLTPGSSASTEPAAPALDEIELQLEPMPMTDEAPARVTPPPPTPKPIAVPPPVRQPVEPVAAEIEEVESPAETIELELSDDAAAAAPSAAMKSPGGLSLDEPAAVGAGQTEDEVGDWGLELEVEEAEAPSASPAAATPPPRPQPVAEVPPRQQPAPPAIPPAAPAAPRQPEPQPVAPGLDFNWGANQDHFLGGMPLQLHPVPPGRGPASATPPPAAPAMPAAIAPAASPPPALVVPEVPHAPVRPTQQSRVIDEPPPAPVPPPPAPPRPVAEPMRPAAPQPIPQQRPPTAPPPPPRQQGGVVRNPLAAEPAPPRQKSQVTTGFDGLALPVNETDVFGGLASGLGAFDQAPVDDVFARRPTSAPQPPAPQQQQQPPAGRTGPRRGPGPARPAAGDPWAPQNAAPPPPTKPPHLGGDSDNGGGHGGGGPSGSSSGAPLVSDSSEDIDEIVLEDLQSEDDSAGTSSAGATPTIPANTPPPPPPRKKRRWFGLKSLILLMMLSMGGSAYGIWRTMPSKSSVTAQLQFANFGALPVLERKNLENQERHFLADESLRIDARSKVIAKANKTDPGFIDNAADYARTVSLAQLNQESGIFSIPFVGGASLEDQTRMMALAQALYDANGKMVAEANELNRTVDSLTRERADAQKQIDTLTKQIDDLGATAANGPTAADRAKMEADAATLEQTYKAALASVTELEEKLKKLRENPAAAMQQQGAAASQPTSTDAVLDQLQGDLKKLNDRVAAAQDDKSDKAAAARAKLDTALAAFNQQIAQAQGAVKNNPELLAYVDNAQKLMGSSRELIDQLIKRQQDQYAQLTELKVKLNDKMLARRGELWKKDKELVTLMDRKDITERQYNAAVGAGMTQQANDKKQELNLLDSQIKARQTLVADDGFYADAIDQLQKIIDTTQKGLEDDRRLTNQRLDEMQATFTASQPPMEKLTPEQKSLAEEMSKRLDEVTLARRQYTEAAAAANQQANEEMQNLQVSASDLENKVQARKKELAGAAPAVPPTPPPAPSPAQQKQVIDKVAGELAAAEKTRSEAETSYFAANKNLLAIKDKIEQSRKAGEDRDNLIRQKDIVAQNLTQLDNQLDLKRTLAKQKTYPIAPTAADIKVDRKDDKRPMYTMLACGGIFGFFMLLFLVTGGGSRGEDSLPEPAQLYLPEEGYDLERGGGNNPRGHEEDVFAQAPPRHEQQQSPVEV